MSCFTYWLKEKVEEAIHNGQDIPDTLRWLAHGPTLQKKGNAKIKHRGSALKPKIAKNRSKGIKLKIEYNSLGSHIEENSVN
ncbi:hypothetical protein CK203_106773 [Vitis vinifera]|uniref:Uncharacterized protein n=1 Tax=Vitis vinifera TaxID=29760 RepID=A0A438BVQ9_VITVI|nr:hypothetical protein CK203_106773 [Vitis vinifera]